MVTSWVRGQESVDLVTPRRTPLRCSDSAGAWELRRRGSPPGCWWSRASTSCERRYAEARGQDRAVRRPVHRVRRHPARTAPTARSRRRGPARWPRSSARSLRSRSGAHTPAGSPTTDGGEDPGRRAQRRGRHDAPPDAGPGRQRGRDAADAGPRAARRPVAQRGGRDRRPARSPTRWWCSAGTSTSWDVGQGAMDDGGGSVAAWEAVRLMHRLGLRPRRTVRVVLWTNEENGGRGRHWPTSSAHRDELAKHVLAMESDNGVFNPQGRTCWRGPTRPSAVVQQVGRPAPADQRRPGHQRVDEQPRGRHHAAGDARRARHRSSTWTGRATSGITTARATPWTSSTRRKWRRCVAAMAVMAYVVADLPDRLPS